MTDTHITSASSHAPLCVGDANPRDLSCVLVTRFSALGDVALTVPVLYSACRIYTDIHFVMVTRQAMTAIFINPPANLTVVGVNLNQYKGVAGLWKLFRELKAKYKFNGYMDLHDVLRTKIFGAICRMYGIPVSVINKGRKGKRALTRRHNKVLLPLSSTRARYRQVFHHIGLPVTNQFEGLYGRCGRGNLEDLKDIFPAKKSGDCWVGIAPFAKHEGKIYPPELMEQVVQKLVALNGVTIFFFGGGEKEEQVLREWTEKYPGTISVAKRHLGFAKELDLVSNLNVMLTMDSANMHLASLVNTPVVSVWGATHPYCGFKGWRQREDDMVQLPMTCRPCSVFGNKPCFRGDYHCLHGISPVVIFEHLMKYISANPNCKSS